MVRTVIKIVQKDLTDSFYDKEFVCTSAKRAFEFILSEIGEIEGERKSMGYQTFMRSIQDFDKTYYLKDGSSISVKRMPLIGP